MEHNVAQVCGNLWWDPINWDGTPKGFQLFRECGGEFSWEYRSLGESPADPRMAPRPGGQAPGQRRGKGMELGFVLDGRMV